MAVDPLVTIRDPRSRPDAGIDLRARLERLEAWRPPLGKVVVAYSGGVDSSVLFKVAHQVLGTGALGVIGRADSYSERELRLALEQAESFGGRVEIVTTGELADQSFSSNP